MPTHSSSTRCNQARIGALESFRTTQAAATRELLGAARQAVVNAREDILAQDEKMAALTREHQRELNELRKRLARFEM